MEKRIARVHFIGVCGTAMGAVAIGLRERGYRVTGSDENVYPPMSDVLAAAGIEVKAGFDAANIPPDSDLVVIGNAVRRGNPEAEAALNEKRYYLSLPEVLKGFFLRGKHNIVVAGTHGKTTTASLVAWMFESAGLAPGYMIGGIPKNLGRGANLRDAKHFIVEGDEYDTAFFDKRSKFVHYLPELVIVNNIEFDHADIFRDIDEIKLSFRRLLNIVPGNGMVLLNGDDPNCVAVGEGCMAPIVEVGMSPNAANCIRDVSASREGTSFRVSDEEFFVPLFGDYNVRNAAMAASAARFYGISADAIRKALATFEGVNRRQEVRGIARGITVIDDFGHHPTAIAETLRGLRRQYGARRIWAVFEPRSNTMRRAVFQRSLPEAFDAADGVLIAPVARADQLPEGDRLDPEKVVGTIREAGKKAFFEPTVDAIIERLRAEVAAPDLIVVFSNGGFGNIHRRLLDEL
jgi:UDP-N-acetylmuramate: L-alanyl-gamma-D-glutamyl-meso-diaminopimelate ligase